MRLLPAPTTAAFLLFAPQVLVAQTQPAVSTAIPRQQILDTLKQPLPGAPLETGGGLFDGSGYRIGALKRKLPGQVEIHRDDTDIMYLLTGKVTLLTGGSVVGRHPISSTEERGSSLRNGVRHVLSAGDMIVIPKGQPHWFQNVAGEVSYLVIKVQSTDKPAPH